MTHLIKLKNAVVEPAELAPGEVAIDETSRLLYTLTGRGVRSLPLDRVALEAADPQASSQAYLYRPDAIARRAELDPGAGGAARDAQPWFIPGLTPQSVGTLLTAEHLAWMEVQEPLTLRTLRTTVLSGVVSGLDVAVLDDLGRTRATSRLLPSSPAPNLLSAVLSLRLDPGRYAIQATCAAPATFQIIEGRLGWRGDAAQHLIMMETL